MSNHSTARLIAGYAAIQEGYAKVQEGYAQVQEEIFKLLNGKQIQLSRSPPVRLPWRYERAGLLGPTRNRHKWRR